jgi:hypothetical protein
MQCQCINISSGLQCRVKVIPGSDHCYLHQKHFSDNNIATVSEWNAYAQQVRASRGGIDVVRVPRAKRASKKASPKKAKKESTRKWIRSVDTFVDAAGFNVTETYANGKLHSYNDKPAQIIRNPARGEQTLNWFKFGKLYRAKGPVTQVVAL